MSRSTFVSCFFALPVALTAMLTTAAAEPPVTVIGEAEAEVRMKIESALDEPISVDFMSIELADVCAHISEVSNIPILLDEPALRDVGLDSDVPVDLAISDISTRAVLKHILRPLNLTWIIRDEVLLITTPDSGCGYALVTKIYSVHDLVTFVDEEGVEVYDFDSLVEAITRTIEPTSWDEIGGPGSITAYQATGLDVLFISQDETIHREVELLLGTLRRVRHDEALENGPRLIPRRIGNATENGETDSQPGFGGGGGQF